MGEKICSWCRHPCETRMESGVFDANGPFGTIRGDLGDSEVSDCCGEPIEEIDDDE